MFDLQSILTLDGIISLLTLSLLEIVLGIDNIIFISIVSGKLPKPQQRKARIVGLTLALLMRIVLLFSISWIASLKNALFYIDGFGVTGRDLILFAGGVFLTYKTIKEIIEKIQHKVTDEPTIRSLTMRSAILQIIFLDMVFSFDSILTAVGLVTNVLLMILAVVIGMAVMLIFAGSISDFIDKHPTVKMLALSFLVMIGLLLMLEAFHIHIEKGYVYTAFVFSLTVELLNMAMRSQARKKSK